MGWTWGDRFTFDGGRSPFSFIICDYPLTVNSQQARIWTVKKLEDNKSDVYGLSNACLCEHAPVVAHER